MTSNKVGIYIRLSKEDLDKDKILESESIINQRKLIYKYAQDEGLDIKEEYVDDGYSGTNFDRPSFNRMINDIKKGNINVIITKDLSRLGRDYVKTGYYMEDFFPKYKVRYISILDGIDTRMDTVNNDIAPFKALFNDIVSKDTSKKIKSILKNKKEQGLFLGSKAPFGYRKSPNDKHKLEINKKESVIVKKIFDLSICGYSNNYIAKFLNDKHIPSPLGKLWSSSSVYNILNNHEYTGCLISNVWTNISYKNKSKVKRSPHEWIILDNMHTPIITKEMFDKVKKRRKISPIKRCDKQLLEGLVYCEECGCLLGANYIKKRGYFVLSCNGYKRNTKSCTSHYIRYDKLESLVISRFQNILSHLDQDKINRLNNCCNDAKENGKKQLRTLEKKLQYLYSDRLNDVIDVDTYKSLASNINHEIDNIKNSITKDELLPLDIDRDLLFLLIDKITINKDKVIKIKYNFKMLSL